MARGWLACILAWSLLGCHSGEEPVRGANKGVEPAATFQPSPRAADRPVDAPIPPPSEPLVVVDEPEQTPQRDLSAELKAAVGIPTDCVRDFQASGPTTIRISISAVVRPTGMIIEPSAYGSGLSEAARKCIEQRIGLAVLDPLDEPTSQVVSAIIEINYEPPVIVESEPGTPEPRLRNVMEPLPKRPTIAPSGRPIEITEGDAIEGGKETERAIQGPTGQKISGPKPRPIDGYEVDENAQNWR